VVAIGSRELWWLVARRVSEKASRTVASNFALDALER
jgi:hypothetical protein